jgi:preprotein translocase subunit SecD
MGRNNINLILIIVVLAAVIWIDLPETREFRSVISKRSLQTQLGLDLRGGLRVSC